MEKQFPFSLAGCLVSAVTLCYDHTLAMQFSVCLPRGHPSTFKSRFLLKAPPTLVDLSCYVTPLSLSHFFWSFCMTPALYVQPKHCVCTLAWIQGLVLSYNPHYITNRNKNYFLLFSLLHISMFPSLHPPPNIRLIHHHPPSRSNPLCY